MSDDHEIRELKFKLKRAHATMGKQGTTIHALRGELAETRLQHAKIERDYLKQLERENATLRHECAQVLSRMEKLRDNYKALQAVIQPRELTLEDGTVLKGLVDSLVHKNADSRM